MRGGGICVSESARGAAGGRLPLDPEFSSAYAHLSRAQVISYVNRWGEDPERLLDQTVDLCERAIELNQANPYAHYSLAAALLWKREHDRSIEEARRAIELDSNFVFGHAMLGVTLVYVGEPGEAVDCFHRSMRLDPHYRDITLHWHAQAHFHLGHYEQAVALLQRRLVRRPDSDISHVLLASVYGHLGGVEKSRAEWADALRVNPDNSLEHRREVRPYEDPARFEQIRAGLAKSGPPD